MELVVDAGCPNIPPDADTGVSPAGFPNNPAPEVAVVVVGLAPNKLVPLAGAGLGYTMRLAYRTGEKGGTYAALPELLPNPPPNRLAPGFPPAGAA